MGSLTDAAENRALDWLTGNATTAPTLPLKVRLMTANGSDSAAGTQVAGGTYAPVTIAPGAAVTNVGASNPGILDFAGMPVCTVVGFEIWDSAGTPFRWWWGAASVAKTYAAGDVARFDVGALALTMD